MLQKVKIEDEYIPPCYICGKVWQRKDATKWLYYSNIVVCTHHHGVKEWYNEIILYINNKIKKHKGEINLE